MHTKVIAPAYLPVTLLRGLTAIAVLVYCLAYISNVPAADPIRIAYAAKTTNHLPQPHVPGRLVNVGTHRLHIDCRGSGRPTVVVDAGLGAISLEWTRIQAAIAKRTRICLYDRAGYGYSDPGPLPRTSSYIVDELYHLLMNARIKGPFILVGHSFGGYNMQLFASRYPHISAGVVLVDSSHIDQYRRFLAQPIHVKTSPPNRTKLGIVRFSPPPIHPHLPEEVRNEILGLMLRQPMRYAMAYEFYNFRQSAKEVREGGPFPNVPLLVLTRGKRVYPYTHKGDLMRTLWMQLQTELSERSQFSAHAIADKSGHFIHLDQPQLVIDAISMVIGVVKYQSVKRSHPAEAKLVLEPRWYDFIDVTWKSNHLYHDPVLSYLYPETGNQNEHTIYAGPLAMPVFLPAGKPDSKLLTFVSRESLVRRYQ
ncbi:MAG: alpha/beta fold hydrolase [Gammaproteobacteria bacterium]